MYIVLWLLLLFLSFIELVTKNRKFSKIFFTTSLIILIFVGGLRHEVGTDYGTYLNIFSGINHINSYAYLEPGFVSIVYITKVAVSSSPYVVFFVFATLTIIVLSKGVFRFSYFPILSIFLYFQIFYIGYSFNAIRQGLAMSLFIFALDGIINNKRTQVLTWTIIATSIHFSGVFILISYVFTKIKLNKNHFILLLIGSVILFQFNHLFSSILISTLPSNLGNKLSYYAENFNSSVTWTSLIQRILIILPFILYYNKLNKNAFFKKLFNIYALGFAFYVIFSFQGMFATRINMFFRILEIILIPMLLSQILNYRIRIFAFAFVCIWSSLLLLSDLNNADNFPYKTVLTSEHI